VLLRRVFRKRLEGLREHVLDGGAVLGTPRRFLLDVVAPSLGSYLARLAIVAIFLAAAGAGKVKRAARGGTRWLISRPARPSPPKFGGLGGDGRALRMSGGGRGTVPSHLPRQPAVSSHLSSLSEDFCERTRSAPCDEFAVLVA
jgi:hypothetical protein